MVASCARILFPWETVVPLFPSWFKKPVCSDCPDFPKGCILACELIVLAWLPVRLHSQCQRSQPQPGDLGLHSIQNLTTPTGSASRPHVVTCVCLFKPAWDKVCWKWGQGRRPGRECLTVGFHPGLVLHFIVIKSPFDPVPLKKVNFLV